MPRTSSIEDIYSSDGLDSLFIPSTGESTEPPLDPVQDAMPRLIQEKSTRKLLFSENDVKEIPLIDRGTYYQIPSEVS